MNGWTALQEELDAWHEAGRAATFWWRDDDAAEPAPALDRLLDLADQHRVPLALAVIPAATTAALTERLAKAGDHVCVLQHGYDHGNHAPDGEKSMELGAHRPLVAIREDLAAGRAKLTADFGRRALPVLVPPWNRIAADLLPELAGLGFRGLSTHTARAAPSPAEGLVACNTHIDVLRWRPVREFLGEAAALDLLIGHLSARRRGTVDADEPSGLLTHHLVMDEAAWAFVARLFDALRDHPAARWVPAAEAFHLTAAIRTGP